MTYELSKKLIEKYYETIALQDLNSFLALLSEEVVHDINQGATEVGKSAFKQFMENSFKQGKDIFKNMIILTSPDGKYAATSFSCAGIYNKDIPGFPKANGQAWEIPVVSFFEINNNLISRVSVHYNVQAWLKQISI